ncbi:MAG: hypothetical protein MUF62_08310 [Chitinophagaceae bacterium]|nr:hypothetical protein [Chitinophagaceae bacterium]
MMTSNLPEGLQSVRFAYVLIGMMSLLTTLPTAGLLLFKYFQPKTHHSDPIGNNETSSLHCADRNGKRRWSVSDTPTIVQSKTRKNLIIIYMAIVFVLTFFYGGLEITGRSFFTSFAICYLSWPVAEAALLTSVLYVTFTVGRLIGIPLSTKLRPLAMFVIDMLLVFFGFSLLLLLLVIQHLSSWIAWLSAVMVALGLSTAFSALVFVNAGGPEVQLIGRSMSGGEATAKVLQGMMFGGNIGLSLFPLAVGSLFDNVSPMWVVYLPLLAITCIGLLIIFFPP